ncbi:uncharacterized protein TNCV_621901 [Trichonephila clavipes]|nr:uncharacterized protein TNCV_621901 [Trichonephila clavipes]
MPGFTEGRSGDLLCFLMRTGSILVPVMAIYWLEEDQVNASNQSICDLDTLNMHQELWSGEQFRGYPTQPECKLARQSDD